jgi:hypothetical protein
MAAHSSHSDTRSDSRFSLAGEVVCSDIANSRAVHRFVQKWVGQWIAQRWTGDARPACYFHVTFTRQGSGHTVGCEARVQVGGELWQGARYGDTLSDALKQSLEHMTPLTLKAPIVPATTTSERVRPLKF